MPYQQEILDSLSEKAGNISSKSALVGLDWFAGKICNPIDLDRRFGPGNQFEPISTISDYADRVKAAAGKSTHIELFESKEKLGGNGHIMANALLITGMKVRHIGAVGNTEVHSFSRIFQKRLMPLASTTLELPIHLNSKIVS